MPRGGRRTGNAGTAYGQRTDLQQAVRTAPGQPYGQAKAQADAQRAIPLPASAPPPMAGPQAGPMAPPDPGMLHGPTTRPGEPVTAGLPVGAGPGPEALAGPGMGDQVLTNLYRAYQMAPTEGLRQLIQQAEALRATS